MRRSEMDITVPSRNTVKAMTQSDRKTTQKRKFFLVFGVEGGTGVDMMVGKPSTKLNGNDVLVRETSASESARNLEQQQEINEDAEVRVPIVELGGRQQHE